MEALKEKPGPQRGRMTMDRWNDDRLDELSRRMDEGFKGISLDIKAGFEKIDQRFEKIDQRFEKIDERFEKVDGRFEKFDGRFAELASRESVYKLEAKLGRFEERIDRLYWAYVALAVLLIANGIIGNV